MWDCKRPRAWEKKCMHSSSYCTILLNHKMSFTDTSGLRSGTLKAMGSVLLQRQCVGRTEQRKLGLSVRTSSPGWSESTSTMLRSAMRSLPTRAAPLLSWAPRGNPSFIFPELRVVEGGVKRRPGAGSETQTCIRPFTQLNRKCKKFTILQKVNLRCFKKV